MNQRRTVRSAASDVEYLNEIKLKINSNYIIFRFEFFEVKNMINLKHLHYFWVVAKQGGVAKASEVLHLTPQTISGQINQLEDNIGHQLFNRVGRNLN